MKDGNRGSSGAKQGDTRPVKAAKASAAGSSAKPAAAKKKSGGKGNGLVSHVRLTMFLLRNGKATVKQIAREIGRDEKTARNWLKALVEKMPDEFEETRSNKMELLEVRSKQALADGRDLTALRVAALRLAINAFPHLRETALADELDKACAHAFQSLPADGLERERAKRSFDHMLVSKTRILTPSIAPDLLDELVYALVGLQTVELAYEKFDGSSLEETVEPLSLLFTDEGVQLYAKVVDSPDADRLDERRIFQTARIRSVSRTGTEFLYPSVADYNPAKVWADAFGSWLPDEAEPLQTIELAFRPAWRTWFNTTRVHASQTDPKDLPSGDGFTVSFRLKVTLDFIRWVRGFGKAVKVVSPAGLLAAYDDPEKDWP